jgi:hypothetical protein
MSKGKGSIYGGREEDADFAVRQMQNILGQRAMLGEMPTSDTVAYEEEQALKRQEAMRNDQEALAAISSQAQQPSKVGQVGQMATAGGMASANPYVAGAGIALQGIGMVDEAKRRNEQAKIDAYNKKIMAQRAAVRNLFA